MTVAQILLAGKDQLQALESQREVFAEAVSRMVAMARGANAVVNVRFSTSSDAAGAAELNAYGTAVRLRSLISREGWKVSTVKPLNGREWADRCCQR